MKNKLLFLGMILLFLIINVNFVFAQSAPTYTYSISTGRFTSSAPDSWSTTGYSGGGAKSQTGFNAEHKNNPASTHITDYGPIPAGTWRITGFHDTITKNTIILEPIFSTNRTLMRIHGDSTSNPGQASNGCIVLDASSREKIVAAYNKYGTLTLTVTR